MSIGPSLKIPSARGRSAFLLVKKRLEGKAERTTAKVESLWTLSRPVVEARGRLQTAKRLRARRFVFPSNRSRQRCMSESQRRATQTWLCKEEMTAHGSA